MAKLKAKTKKTSENINKLQKKKKLNPFEVHINREKLRVLGKKHKNDRGLPGVSREKALNKRKHTLQQEFKLQHKANKFSDKRIGEGSNNMTDEDKFVARYAKLRAKHHKKSIFNLADEEVLTHKGQTLSEIEKFEDNRSDEDSMDGDDSGKLDSDFVDEAHFGGGILKRTGIDGAKSHKDLIDQLIAESKKRKAEKQKMKEETLELTEKLDTEWKDLIPLVNKTASATNPSEEKADEYDKVMRQLKFEARGTPSDRLKSEDEIAKEEKEKLEMLEKERLDRMHGFTEKVDKRKYYSADDLDDNFAYDSDPEVTLSYNVDGVANINLEAEINGKIVKPENDKEDEQDDDGGGGSEDNSEQGSEEESETEDNLSDLKVDDTESESDDENNRENKNEDVVGDENDQDTIRIDLLKRKEIMDKAREELPYTYTFPEEYETLQKLLQNESPEQQYIILERLIKCNHPSLGEQNKEKLNILFAYLLQYMHDLSSNIKTEQEIKEVFNICGNLTPHLYDLAHMNVENAHNSVLEVIKEKQLEYRKRKGNYPGIDVLLYLNLVACLFSTSDFKHAVVTPAIVFIDQMLNRCKVRTRRDISFGLFVTTSILEYTSLSKRYLPSAINFLSGILHMAIPKTGIKLLKIPPPFKSSSNALVLFNNWSETPELKLQMDFAYLLDGEIEDKFKIRSFDLTLELLREFANNFKDLSSSYEIFLPVEKHLNMLPLNNYPEETREKARILKDCINTMKNRNLEYLIVAKRRPKALRLYEPNIVKIYDTKRHKVQSKEKAERDKMLHKIKRERKGAMREIRRDKSFLGRLKINQQMRSDNERKAKVRKLLSEASLQQSELNAMDRKKKKK